jgi:hypothetical protein
VRNVEPRSPVSRLGFPLCNLAYSGIAAQPLPGGRTTHSTFNVPFSLLGDSTRSTPKSSALGRFLHTVDLIAWDECSAPHGFAPESVDGSLRDIRDCDNVYGGAYGAQRRLSVNSVHCQMWLSV